MKLVIVGVHLQGARSTLGVHEAKSLISICQAEKAKLPASDELDITLQVIGDRYFIDTHFFVVGDVLSWGRADRSCAAS
jgi:hypothetical protein